MLLYLEVFETTTKPPALFRTLIPSRLTACSCASTATSCATQHAAGRSGAASRGGLPLRLRRTPVSPDQLAGIDDVHPQRRPPPRPVS